MKRRHRGKGRRNEKSRTFTVLLANIRGFRSKETSLNDLLKSHCPTICTYKKTLMTGENKVEHKYYISFFKKPEKSGWC